ncbi:MAG TPA: hypothetical protein VIC26_03455 [Marinagarivorans sp.]
MKQHVKTAVKYCLWIIGIAFWLAFVILNWHYPALVLPGGERLHPSTIFETWLIRSTYIVVVIAAVYREWAEAQKGDFPPYNPFVMIVLLVGYFSWVYGFLMV